MIIKRGKERSSVVLLSMMHDNSYPSTLKNVFRGEYLLLEKDEFIRVLVQTSSGDCEIFRCNNENWDPSSYDEMILSITDKIKQDDEDGKNTFLPAPETETVE
jgi:hypothetical protein